MVLLSEESGMKREAVVFPLYDAGNIGMQMRDLHHRGQRRYHPRGCGRR
jgi:hypothetical protein